MYGINKRIHTEFAVFLLSFCLMCGVAMAGSGAIQAEGNEKKIPSIELSGVPCVSIRAVCEAAGYSPRWDSGARKLTCVKGRNKIVFSEDIPFYSINGSLFQIQCCPIMHGKSLFLQAWVCASVFEESEKETVKWIPEDSAIIVGSSASQHNTASVKAVEAQGQQAELEGEPVNKQIIKTIVIDPGHGGKDPGAIGPDGTLEKDVVLSIALRVGEMLKKKSSCRYI
jgi:N-acetylmuramoyl-L-alanine amidase